MYRLFRMGTGNKLNPGCFEITDISKTSVCPLAKVMRQELKKRGIKVKVLYSKELPVRSVNQRRQRAAQKTGARKYIFCTGGGRSSDCR